MRLPAELRNDVYARALVDHQGFLTIFVMNTDPNISLLLVSKQVHAEVKDLIINIVPVRMGILRQLPTKCNFFVRKATNLHIVTESFRSLCSCVLEPHGLRQEFKTLHLCWVTHFPRGTPFSEDDKRHMANLASVRVSKPGSVAKIHYPERNERFGLLLKPIRDLIAHVEQNMMSSGPLSANEFKATFCSPLMDAVGGRRWKPS